MFLNDIKSQSLLDLRSHCQLPILSAPRSALFHFWHFGQYQLVRPPRVTLATDEPQTGQIRCP